MIGRGTPTMCTLISLIEGDDSAIQRTSVDDIAGMMEGENGRDWMDTTVDLGTKRNIYAVTSVRALHSIHEAITAVVRAFTHPYWCGRDMGRALLYWQGGRARQMLIEAFGAESGVPASISNLIDAHVTDRRRLYTTTGFFAKRTYQVMYRDLVGGEMPVPARHEYRILPWSKVPRDQTHTIHMEAFQRSFHSPLHALWWGDTMNHFDTRWSFAAVDVQGEIVGYAITGHPARRWVAMDRPEAYIYLLGVAKTHRGRSIAGALVGHAVATASASGTSRIGLDVDISNPDRTRKICEHLGFVDEATEVYYAIDQ